jgi:hypothetical protein
MDVSSILKELYRERELIDQAIASLERAQAGSHKRRGRPPKWLANLRGQAAVTATANAKYSSKRTSKASAGVAGEQQS